MKETLNTRRPCSTAPLLVPDLLRWVCFDTTLAQLLPGHLLSNARPTALKRLQVLAIEAPAQPALPTACHSRAR